jgi:copper chaperone CopZ
MYSIFYVSKSECITCNNQILKSLGTMQGVFGAEMDRINGRIEVSHTDEVTRDQIGKILQSLGLPEIENKIENDEPSIWGCAL